MITDADSNSIKWRQLLLAGSSGLLLTASFPKLGLDFLAWFALVPLLLAVRPHSVRQSFKLGFAAGLVHFLTLLYWLVYTMRTYGNLPYPVAVSILVLMAGYLALYVGAFTAAVAACGSGTFVYFLGIPVFWTAAEYLRSFLLSGFPWELLGYSQYSRLNIIQMADISGVYGISFLIALSNAALSLCFPAPAGKAPAARPGAKRRAVAAMLCFAAVFGLFWAYGKVRIGRIERLAAAAPLVRISVVQASIDEAIKWNPAFQESTTRTYVRLSLSAVKDRPDLIVWPETAVPFYYLANVRLTDIVREGIRKAGTDFLIGSPSFVMQGERIDYYNSAYLIDADGRVAAKYDKVHLVPFGEYVPLKKYLPFLGKMVENVGDFKTGKIGDTVPWRNGRLGIQICFEIIFPGLSRAMVQNQALLLANMTNDAWFGKTAAPYQHFSMAVFRAVENKRSLVRAANTGISGFVDPVGRVVAKTPLFKEVVMTRRVPLMKTSTFYTRNGDIFARGCLLAALLALIWKTAVRFRPQKR